MSNVNAGGLSLWFEDKRTQGDSARLPVLLIQGLGMQATDWPDGLVAEAAKTRRTLCVDNRDVGLSSKLGATHDTALTPADFPSWSQPTRPAAYTLNDMACDILAVMDACGIVRAHLLGYSMGGMIAQILAATAPDRVASVTGLMTSAGQPWLDSSPAAAAALSASIVFEPDPERRLAQMLAAEEIYAAGSELADMSVQAAAARTSLDRSYCPAGIWRQACAIRAGGDRRRMLSEIKIPYLGLHGARDPVISLQQGAICRDLIAGASFHILPDTGHVPTPAVIDRIMPLLLTHWHESE